MDIGFISTELFAHGGGLLAVLGVLHWRLKRMEEDLRSVMTTCGIIRERVAKLEGTRESTNPGFRISDLER